ncbi:MAG: DUF1850 domain-containing protein [Bacillus sp. (in: firmicutes)]
MKKNTLFILLLVLFILLGCFIPYRNGLVFLDEQTKQLLAFAPLKQNQSFQIQFTHSIHLSPVVETYEVTAANELKLIEFSYEDFAVGMPSQAEAGEKFVQANGKYYIKNMNRIFPYIILRVGEVKANHMVIMNDRIIPMTRFTEPGSIVEMKMVKLSVWDQWKGVNIDD